MENRYLNRYVGEERIFCASLSHQQDHTISPLNEEKERFSSSVLTAALVSPELQTKDFHWLMTIRSKHEFGMYRILISTKLDISLFPFIVGGSSIQHSVLKSLKNSSPLPMYNNANTMNHEALLPSE